MSGFVTIQRCAQICVCASMPGYIKVIITVCIQKYYNILVVLENSWFCCKHVKNEKDFSTFLRCPNNNN